jgi:quercetin dioxygenase-like cupin family protein
MKIEESKMNIYTLQRKILMNFAESFIRPVLDNGVSKVVQFSFSKGKVLEKHKTSSDILVFVLQGKIRFKANEEAVLQAGDLVSLEKNAEKQMFYGAFFLMITIESSCMG